MIRTQISEANISPKILVSGWYTKKTPIAPIPTATTELIRITVSICNRVFSVALLTIFSTNFKCYSLISLLLYISSLPEHKKVLDFHGRYFQTNYEHELHLLLAEH